MPRCRAGNSAASGTPEQISAGAEAYGRYCWACHGDAAIAGGLNPDLRHSSMLNKAEHFKAIVIDSALRHNGMVSFQPASAPAAAENIRPS